MFESSRRGVCLRRGRTGWSDNPDGSDLGILRQTFWEVKTGPRYPRASNALRNLSRDEHAKLGPLGAEGMKCRSTSDWMDQSGPLNLVWGSEVPVMARGPPA
jgi:hypothetical protein